MITKGVDYMAYKINNCFLDIEQKNQKISRIHFIHPTDVSNINKPTDSIIIQCLIELHEFLSYNRKQFTVPLDLNTGTAFQQKVWSTLLDIPYGQTCTYKDIAIKINQPRSYQAVGQACKKNPIPIIISCHRVISQSGQLTGYFGTSEFGLTIKQSLITLEKGNHE